MVRVIASIALACLSLAVLPVAPGARAQAEPLPLGLWELAATHKAPFDMRMVEPIGGVLVMSDLTGAVAALRADSGLIVWSRKVPSTLPMSGVWLFPPRGTDASSAGLVLAAGDSLFAVRADVGTRLWERDLGCANNGCQTRVVYAGARDGRDPMLIMAGGGVVQSELARLDPETGKPMWRRPAQVQHPRRVFASSDVIVAEDSLSPYTIRFFNPADGAALGAWEPRGGGEPRPISELLFLPDGRTVAIDMRPPDGLALITVFSNKGAEITERQVPRSPQIGNQPVVAGRVEDGLAIFTPEPMGGVGFVTTMQLIEPWQAKTEQVKSWAEPLSVAGRWAFAPSLRAPGAGWSATGSGRWAREVAGIDTNPARTRTFGAGPRLVLVDLGDAKKSAGVVTIDGKTGRMHGFGAPDLGQGTIDRAIAIGEELVLTRGKALFRLVLVPWHSAVEKLKATRNKGVDIQPFLQGLARFGAPAKALSDAVRGVASGGRTGDGVGAAPTSEPGQLSPEDQRLVVALRASWFDSPAETLAAMLTAVQDSPERQPRRQALLDAFATLLLDLVLAPGVVPRGEDVSPTLVALARALEWEAPARAPSRHTAAVYAGMLALIDEPLAAADLLAKTEATPLVGDARTEAARRALYLLRRSAGPAKTDTSRQMLIAGLRFFQHLAALFGAELETLTQLLDKADADPEALRELEDMIVRAEGSEATRKGAGPALCQLACESAVASCGEGAGDVHACQARCVKTGAVRLGAATRPTPDAKWYCR